MVPSPLTPVVCINVSYTIGCRGTLESTEQDETPDPEDDPHNGPVQLAQAVQASVAHGVQADNGGKGS